VKIKKAADGAIKAFFHFRREVASRQLVFLPVMKDTLATDTLPLTWLISTVATFKIFVIPKALHGNMIDTSY